MADKWVSQGWAKVLWVLYDTDVTIELSRSRVDITGENEWVEIESLHSESPLLTETELSEKQAVHELRYLRDEGLVGFTQPFDDTDFVVHRLTDSGFQVAHDLRSIEQEEEWQEQNTKINRQLTIATVILAVTAIVQALDAIVQQQGLISVLLDIVYIVVG